MIYCAKQRSHQTFDYLVEQSHHLVQLDNGHIRKNNCLASILFLFQNGRQERCSMHKRHDKDGIDLYAAILADQSQIFVVPAKSDVKDPFKKPPDVVLPQSGCGGQGKVICLREF